MRQDALKTANEQLETANRNLKQDLDAAATVHALAASAELPAIPGLRFTWEFRPCQELAGDFLNVLQLDEHHVGVYILERFGHGVAAAPPLGIHLGTHFPIPRRRFVPFCTKPCARDPGAYRVAPLRMWLHV